MENPISYSDLFSPDITQGIEGLISQIQRVEKDLKGMLNSVKTEAQALGEALAGVSSSTKGGRDTTKSDSAQVDKLYEAYNQLSKMYEHNATVLKSLMDAENKQNERLKAAQTATDTYANSLDRLKAQATLAAEALSKMTVGGNAAEIKQLEAVVKGLEQQVKNLTKAQNANANSTKNASGSHSSHKKELLSLQDAYASLAPLVEKTGVDLTTLITTEKQHEQVSKNGVTANTALAGSYNQLYAQYNLLKTALNAMSTEMRANTAVGKEWEAEALRIMNEMKAMQEATGKSTLSVGDYGKALNGLSISTQQVLREMPTLANSVQQFFIAISNNVPIFVDNFKRASAELGGFTKALSATVKAIFSWQTVLLVILTILPRIAKAISDKKKAQEEANKETEKAITLEQLLADMERDLEKSMAQASIKVSVLSVALEDNTRSLEERSAASRILKKDFEDELANFSEEEIIAGKAKDALDRLTESVKKQAEARAILNKMVEYYGKVLDNEPTIAEAQAKYEAAQAATAAARAQYDYVLSLSNMGEAYGKYADILEQAKKNEQAALDVLNKARGETDKYGEAIDALYERLDISALEEKAERGARRIRAVVEKALNIPSYYFEMLQSIVDLTEDALDKELAQFDLDNEILKAKRTEQMDELLDMEEELQKRLKETKDKAKKAEYEAELQYVTEQIANLHQIQLNEEIAFQADREKLLLDIAERRLDIQRKNIQTEQQNARANRDKLAYEEYEAGMKSLDQTEDNTVKEVELKERLNKALLDSEKQYWEDYLAQLRDEGVLTVEEYNKIMSQIAGFNDSTLPTNETSTRRKRGQKQFRNVTELAFATSNTFGEDVFNDKGEKIGRKIQDDYADFANAINEALQSTMDYMDEWMDKRIEMAEVAVEAAQRETESAKTALDYEMEARANGYANNVELARKEYEEKLAMERQAIAERKRLEKIQEGINTAQQIGALVTATANLWSGYSEIPIAGPALAIAATALMWGSFFAAKIQAAQLANQDTYGKGMVEYIDYGGSHQSHNDVDFGRTKDGRQRKVERGEVVAVVRKDKVQKYGVENVVNIFKSINNGTFERNYSPSNFVSSEQLLTNVFGETPENRANSLFVGAKVEDMLRQAESRSTGLKTALNGGLDFNGLEANYEMAFNGGETDLSAIEMGIGKLIEQNSVRVVQTPYGRIEYRGNNKRIVRNG